MAQSRQRFFFALILIGTGAFFIGRATMKKEGLTLTTVKKFVPPESGNIFGDPENGNGESDIRGGKKHEHDTHRETRNDVPPNQPIEEAHDDHREEPHAPVVADQERPKEESHDTQEIDKGKEAESERSGRRRKPPGHEPVKVNQPAEKEHVKPQHTGGGGAMPERQAFVKKMIKHAWDSYAKYAWGYNELMSVAKSGSDSQGIFGSGHLGASLIDALDTLYIAGFMDEYKRGRDWVAKEFSFDNAGGEVSMFEINIRFMGAFLTMYALTGEELYKEKAIDLGNRFAKGFHRASGLSHNAIVLNGYNPSSDNSGPCFVIAEPGTLHLEFAYLSTISGDPKYLQLAERVRDALTSPQMTGLPGLPYGEVNTDTGSPCRTDLSLDGGSDSYYEYVMKSYIQSGKKNTRAKKLFDQFSKTVREKMMTWAYVGNKKYRVLGRTYPGGGIDARMGHLACFSGAMFALGSSFSDSPEETLKLGKDITQACRETYARTVTKIGPDEVQFNTNPGGELFTITSQVYLLRPEVVESYFVLWRVTKDPKYREWGWEAAQAIEKHCRLEGGYTDLDNVNANPPRPRDGVQQSFFLAETLKYLYLLFCDDDVLSLDKWVFNTEAHPFPVDGVFSHKAGVPFKGK